MYGRDESPERALAMMEGDVFDKNEVAACRRFADLARPKYPADELKKRALEIAAGFDTVLCALDKLLVNHERRS